MEPPDDEYFHFQWMLEPDGTTPKRVRKDDIPAWGRWWGTPGNRIVAKTQVGPFEVSTVFLAIDHGWGCGKPVLWETLLFPTDDIDYQDRYTSYEDAIAGHAAAVCYAEAVLAARGA